MDQLSAFWRKLACSQSIDVGDITRRQPWGVIDHSFLDFCMQLWHALIIEWYLATDQDVEDDTETPDVDLRAGILLRL